MTTRMVYRKGTGAVLDGVYCDWKIIDDEQKAIDEALKDNWFKSIPDLKAYLNSKKGSEPLNRNELKILAKEYNIKISGLSDQELQEAIAKAQQVEVENGSNETDDN